MDFLGDEISISDSGSWNVYIRAYNKETHAYYSEGSGTFVNHLVSIIRWDDNFSDLYKIGFSIHLKELNKLPYNSISKGSFEFANIINYNDLVGIYDNFKKVYDTFKAKSEEVNNG